MMKKLSGSAVWIMMLLSVSAFTGCVTYRYSSPEPQPVYENPHWAPPVYSGIRYYYIPDIECYYDIHSREFIYLDHARWMFSPTIPYLYRDFDLNNCFVVIINSNIYQPWMHHQYYVSHFPRYYYRDYYDHSNIPWVRGYDENFRRALYWGENERHRARSWDDANLRNNRQFKYSREDRLQQNSTFDQSGTRSVKPVNTPASIDRNRAVPPADSKNPVPQPVVNDDNMTKTSPSAVPETRRTTGTNYYGRPIGQPVKVERHMRNQSETGESPEESKNKSGNTNTRSNSGRR